MRFGRRKEAPAAPAGRPRLPVRAWRRFRRVGARYRLLRDVLGAILIVAVIAGGLAAATGGVWPPFLVVESSSMTHPLDETPYGRIGTVDVGDIHFVRAVHDVSDVHLWIDGGDLHYGRPGDVIAYAQNGNRLNTTIIHRAITWIDVVRLPNGSTEYRVAWLDHTVKTFGAAGVYLPELGFDERFGFSPTDGYHPAYSGFVTKGDNAVSNPGADQAIGVSAIVDPSWVDGKLYGEVPWMGLGKLALQVGTTNPEMPGDYRVGNAFAPLELWTCFFASVIVILAIPFTLDTIRLWRAGAEGREASRLARRIHRERRARLKAQKRAAKKAARETTAADAPKVAP
jgi:signal peptidase